jgi:LPS sulfotransferase NodH
MAPHRFTSILRKARGLVAKSDGGALPAHPYEEQFSPAMDCPRSEWATRFILIASTPRCGSHYLGHMLGATGQCGVPLEYLNKRNRKYWARRFGTDRMDDLFPTIVQHRTSENGTFTLKAHWKQFHPFINGLDSLTHGPGIEKTIWIMRRDQLAQAISKVIATQTGVWISGAMPTGKARYDFDAIVDSAEANRHKAFI